MVQIKIRSGTDLALVLVWDSPGSGLSLTQFWSQSHLVFVVPPPQQTGRGPAQVQLFLIGHLVHLPHLRQQEFGNL